MDLSTSSSSTTPTDEDNSITTTYDTLMECLNEQDAILSPQETCTRIENIFLNLLQNRGSLVTWTVANNNTNAKNKTTTTNSNDDHFNHLLQQYDQISVTATAADHDENSTMNNQTIIMNGVLRHVLVKKTMSIRSVTFRKALIILGISYDLLKAGKTTTTREIYYCKKQKPTLQEEGFAHEIEVTRAASLASILVQVTRASLGILGASKGSIMGNIQWRTVSNNNMNNDWISANSSPTSIPEIVNPTTLEFSYVQKTSPVVTSSSSSNSNSANITAMMSENNLLPKFILVVEKFTVFHNIAQSQFMKQTPCILITGRGFPDIGTRVMLKLLSDTLQIPVYGLCDFNPHGISIMLTYAVGSVTTTESYHWICPSLRVIGLSYHDIERHSFTESDFNPWTKADDQCLTSLLTSKRLLASSEFSYLVQELWYMNQLKKKVDLEALLKWGPEYLSNIWLSSKVVVL
jgi:meiotic recombination protein SPO11